MLDIRNIVIPARMGLLCAVDGEDHVPEAIHTDKLWSDWAAPFEKIPVLYRVEHVQVVSAARRNSLIEQSYRPTRQQERSWPGFKRQRRTQEFLALHAGVSNLSCHARTSFPAALGRRHQTASIATPALLSLSGQNQYNCRR